MLKIHRSGDKTTLVLMGAGGLATLRKLSERYPGLTLGAFVREPDRYSVGDSSE